MAAIANVTLTDAAATPVNRVFNPTRRENGGELVTYHNRASGIVVGFDALSIQSRQANKTTKATKITLKLVTPILEQTSPSTSSGIQPAPTVAYNLIGTMEFVLPDRSDLQDRKDLLAMCRDLLDEAIVTQAVENYDFPY
jgi:hypothetical protein